MSDFTEEEMILMKNLEKRDWEAFDLDENYIFFSHEENKYTEGALAYDRERKKLINFVSCKYHKC